MWSWSDIHTTTTKRIDTVFRIVIALMLYAQVVSLVTFLVVAVKNTSWGWYNSAFRMVGSSSFYPMIADEKKVLFEKVTFDFDQQNTINTSPSIRRCFFWYYFKKIKRRFVLIIVFYTTVVIEAILSAALGKSSL